MKSYQSDEHLIGLDALQARLESTDLIPSQKSLLDGLPEKLTSIRKAGVSSLADLRSSLKTEETLTIISESSGVDVRLPSHIETRHKWIQSKATAF